MKKTESEVNAERTLRFVKLAGENIGRALSTQPLPIFDGTAERIPEGRSGQVEVRHWTLTQLDCVVHAAGNWMTDPDASMLPGTYASLTFLGADRDEETGQAKDLVVMSDTIMERRSNLKLVQRARGDVLLAGLGLGMVIPPILQKPDVRSLTVIENNPDVIRLVAPYVLGGYRAHGQELRIIEADIFRWLPHERPCFDTIYFDIWAKRGDVIAREFPRLHRRFAPYLRRGGWMDSWYRAEHRKWVRRSVPVKERK